jgi:hypothetical protein
MATIAEKYNLGQCPRHGLQGCGSCYYYTDEARARMDQQLKLLKQWGLLQRMTKRAHYNWAHIDAYTAEDLFMDTLQYFLERPTQIDKVMGMSVRNRNKTISWIIHRELNEAMERNYEATGQLKYSVKEIRTLLEMGVLYTEMEHHWWLPMFILQGMEALEARDLKRDSRGKNHYPQALWDRYGENGQVPKAGKDRKHLSMALTALSREVNKAARRHYAQHEGPGSARRSTVFDMEQVSARMQQAFPFATAIGDNEEGE